MSTINLIGSDCPEWSGLMRPARHFSGVLSAAFLALTLVACGGAGGSDSGDIAQDGLNDLILSDPAVQQQDLSCAGEIDIAEFILIEANRQWSCEISSVVGTRFDELYFDRNGTASFASTGLWYWNRNLPEDEINLASPAEPSSLMTDIGSSNSVLVFRTVNDVGVEEIYDCVLVERELLTTL